MNISLGYTDENTGLPALAAGYFFRIKPWGGNLYSYNLKIEVRRRLKWFGWVKVGETLTKSTDLDIKYDAKFAISHANKNLNKNAKWGYVGDYPPKKLER